MQLVSSEHVRRDYPIITIFHSKSLILNVMEGVIDSKNVFRQVRVQYIYIYIYSYSIKL